MLRIYFLLPLLMILSSCTDKSLSPVEYRRYLYNPENMLIKAHEFGSYTIQAHLKPAELMVVNYLGVDNLSRNAMREELPRYSGSIHVELKLAKTNGSDLILTGNETNEEVQQRIHFFYSELQKRVSLVSCGDTLQPSLFHMERTYGITPYRKFNLAFDRPLDAKCEQELIVKLEEPHRLVFKKEDISKIPNIEL